MSVKPVSIVPDLSDSSSMMNSGIAKNTNSQASPGRSRKYGSPPFFKRADTDAES